MASCPPRSVLGAGDRPGRIREAAKQVQEAANAIQPRVLPHAGAPGGQPSAAGRNPIKRGGGGPMMGTDPIADAISKLGNAIDNFAREVSSQVDQIANEAAARSQFEGRFEIQIHIGAYAEPLLLPKPNAIYPVCIIAGRVVDMAAPTTAVLTGALVHWAPVAQGRQAALSIDGMTPNDGKTYAFTFLYFGQ